MDRIPMCWKCVSAIIEGDETEGWRVIGCKECIAIQSYYDAKELCPLIQEFNDDET